MRNRATIALVVAAGIAAAIGCSGAPSSTSGPEAGPVEAASTSHPGSAAIDAALDKAWAAKGVVASADIDDATFLRRVTIDLAGRIPTTAEASAFLDDKATDKRARAVDRLLASPEHDRHLARTWERILLGEETKARVVDRAAFRRYLERRFAEGAKWDQLVREIVTAEGKTSLGGSYKRGAQLVDDADRSAAEKAEGVSGAANYFMRFAKSPQDLAGTTSRAFLGVQIQCAQCHDHKTEAWKQTDFQSFASTMSRVKIEPVERDKGMMAVYEVSDVQRAPRRMLRDDELRKIVESPPRALDGTDLSGSDDLRGALADWMTSKDNPWFSRAIANRVWAELMGQGLVEPVDDFREKNPPVAPEVLALLAEGFETSGFDLDSLYRTVALSKAYGRSVAEGKGSPRDALFSRAGLRPLPSDVLLDSVFVATDLDALLEDRAPERAEMAKALLRRQLRFVFDDDTESNGESYDGTLQQAFFSMNGALPLAATAVGPGTVLGSLSAKDDDTVITELWLRTFSRRPAAAELAEAKAFLAAPHPASGEDGPTGPAAERRKGKKAGAKAKGKGKAAGNLVPPAALRSQADTDRERALEDLFWTLLNASEFNFRR